LIPKCTNNKAAKEYQGIREVSNRSDIRELLALKSLQPLPLIPHLSYPWISVLMKQTKPVSL
jgi:hypothetical protein